ncbi:hypothetical protein [Paracoccus tibetensis]|uniref:Rod binding protein n=1 Tax=Paracoccus tibetensis TaxID=336292 RepID=A0A1G5ER45_9RHOB|nr:hypothetical protein [Paracoccus tibetensis]SCY29485.1 hypothetical protein SAMN05660710_01200 [Paracoccus tibetensis]
MDPLHLAAAPVARPAPQSMASTSLADQVEQMFLEEMLKHCGPGALGGSFGGGAGEEQFSSFLTREHAALLARRLDLGLGNLEAKA